jgi:hypothetical protein
MGGYNSLQMVFQGIQMNARIELRAAQNVANRVYNTAVNVANSEATAREQQYYADCGDLVVSAQKDYEAAVLAADAVYQTEISKIDDSAEALQAASETAKNAYEASLKSLQNSFDSVVSKAGSTWESCVKAGTTDAECTTAKDATIAAAVTDKETASAKAKADFDTAVANLDAGTATAAAQAKKDAAIAAAAEVRSAALASVAIPNEPSIVVPALPAEPVFIDAPVDPLPAANPGDPAPPVEPPVATPIEVVPVPVVSELDSVVTSQVQETATVTCSDSCVDALQFSARTEGDVYFQYTSNGKVDNDAWIKVESGQKFESSKLGGGIAIQVRPTDLSDPITLIKDAEKSNFAEVSADSTDDSGSLFNLRNILIVLILVGVVLFIVSKRRNKEAETK